MSPALYVMAALFLLSIGASGGNWLASSSYQPKLDEAITNLATAKAGRENLEALATEQGLKLGELVLLGKAREIEAAKAQVTAQVGAKTKYSAANDLMRERTGGDQCAAATEVIDKELFGL